ncbi:MAG TPA: hypothetical protein PLR66_12195 [Planctomycetota bacterium]|jgi:hypothetical protein|nr:hypothetical protein [Planctomycetota bacterium]
MHLVLCAASLLRTASWEQAGDGEAAAEGVRVRSGVLVQWVPVMGADGPLEFSGVLQVDAVEGRGEAFVALCEHARDLAELGPPWAVSRTEPGVAAITRSIEPGEATAFLSVRVGFHAARGALLARELQLRRSGAAGAAIRYDAAILDEPGLGPPGIDAAWAESTLRAAEIAAARFPAEDFGAVLRGGGAGLVILPYGERFPADLLWPLVCFCARGGSFVSLGGYAFRRPVRKAGEAWVPAEPLSADTRPNLVFDGGFERSAEAPLGGVAADGRWRRVSRAAFVSDREPFAGAACAAVAVLDEEGPDGGAWYLDLPSRPGGRYLVRARFKSGPIRGGGYGFFAFYQYAGDRVAAFRDLAAPREATPWREVRAAFDAEPGADRVRIVFGIYRGFGEVFCDEVELKDATGLEVPCITTERGKPGDGLEVPPWRIGVFDADFPLARVAAVRPSAEQRLLRAPERAARLTGWSAQAVVRPGKSRWVPLLDCLDRHGELCGAAGGLVGNHAGLYAGSRWAFFGAADEPLFGPLLPESGADFARLAGALRRNVWIAECYPLEPVVAAGGAARLRVTIAAFGSAPARFALLVRAAGGEQVLERVCGPGAAAAFDIECGPVAPGLGRARVELRIDGEAIDCAETAWYAGGAGAAAATPLRFEGNYFTLGGRAMFLFGADNYGNDFDPYTAGPAGWDRLCDASRDLGLQIYEVLLPPGFDTTPGLLAQVRAQGELLAGKGLIYMPGFLIGHNAAGNEDRLRAEEAAVKAGVAALRDLPRAIWYLNGDFQWREDDLEWLRERWRVASGDPGAEYPPAAGGAWDDETAAALARFKAAICEAWCRRHVGAVRAVETDRPVTSEYYQIPLGPLDPRLTIAEHTCANIGFFDLPGKDIENLPRCLAANDLRYAGKGIGLGEYGAKTHPAWVPEAGDLGYHTARTAAEKERLFAAVVAYTLGMGGSRVQTWCLRDADDRVFPWGLVRAGRPVPRDAALLHRNLSLLARAIEPVDRAPRVGLVSPTLLRLGNGAHKSLEALYAAVEALLALKAPFTVLDDFALARAPLPYEVLVYPAALALGEGEFAALRAYLAGGGRLVFSGDFARDELRRPAAPGRLAALLAFKDRAAALPGPIALEPSPAFERALAEALDAVGAGGCRLPHGRLPAEIHAFSLKTRTGELAVFCPFRRDAPFEAELPGGFELSVAAGWPVFVHLRGADAALFAGDGALLRRGAVLCRADGFTGVMALDGRGLCESAALAILPWRARGLTLGACGARGAPILIGGLLKAGRFEARTARRLGAELCLAFDPEDPQLLFLLCGEAEKDRWSSALAAQFYAAENTPGL